MRSLLVTGASGFLGWHAAQQLASDWQIWGTYHRQAIALPTGTALPLDVTNAASMQATWATARPDAVAAFSRHLQGQSVP
ncbi:MAG TPA: NAD-dependent epimerase/dehydratase family protein, partial [Candidatus Obscuribacterales bacterium]